MSKYLIQDHLVENQLIRAFMFPYEPYGFYMPEYIFMSLFRIPRTRCP
jgi:hypothetical protein